MNTLVIILVILAAIFICYQSKESFKRPGTRFFPRTGICSQNCRDYDDHFFCDTMVDGKPTVGCEWLRNTPGTVPLYQCTRSIDNTGRKCMRADS